MKNSFVLYIFCLVIVNSFAQNATNPIAVDDFFHVSLGYNGQFTILTNDQIEETETYQITIIERPNIPSITVELTDSKIDFSINREAFFNDFIKVDENLNPEDSFVFYGDGGSSHGGTYSYLYKFKYVLCDTQLNCDTANVTLAIPVLMALDIEIHNSSVQLYPNPVHNQLHISNRTHQIENIKIYDAQLKLCSSELNVGLYSVAKDVSSLKTGLYLVAIKFRNSGIAMQKIYKR